MIESNCCKEYDNSTSEDPFQDNREAFCKFLECQREEMLKEKWIQSEQNHRDMGQDCIRQWIQKYAKQYREYYCREVLKIEKDPVIS